MTRTKAQLISGWTERHLRVGLALAVAVTAGAIATAEPAPFPIVSAVIVVATAAAALCFDGFGGIVVGIAGAAAAIAAKQWGGAWTERGFAVSLALTLALVTLGWLVGMVSSDLHGRLAGSAPDDAKGAAYGSLGLLTTDMALARLDEEVLRARHHRRPLTVAVLRLSITDETLDAAARDSAERSAARLVETLLRDSDVPFAIGPDEFGAILPETNRAGAWGVLGPVLDAAGRAAFTVREAAERRNLADCAELHAGLVSLNDRFADADSLLEAARRSAQAEEAHAHPPDSQPAPAH